MRTLAKAAASSLKALCAGLAFVVVCVAAIGVLGTHSSAKLGSDIASDELTTSTATAQLARDIDAAYATGEAAFLASGPGERSRRLGTLYTSLLPAADVSLAALVRLHADDPPTEHAGIEQLVRQWAAVRDLLSPANAVARPAAALAAAYQPLSAHLNRLLLIERRDAQADRVTASANAARLTWSIIGVAVLGLLAGGLLLRSGIRRIRRNLEPGQDQAEFADTLQLAGDEDEAHLLLRRHLERTLAATAAVVLNRNNSADRLEAVTPLPGGSPLAETLRGAEPRSCLAVRSGRTHRLSGDRAALLGCAVCGPCPGASTCVPLTVGGEVIGSVLLTHPAPYGQDEEQRIQESVGQAAPVLANLRNLAVAEIRAATDGLTGLPNKRAVTDAMKRMFAQASQTTSPLGLLVLDLDHFKQINDQRGHPVGDQVLANVGAVLRSVLRARDFAGRNGGEEFAIILPDTGVHAALEIAERIRAAVAEISLAGTDVSVTASIGVAGFPDHATSLDRLEWLADAALYLAKRQGRNRVELADPATAESPDGPAGNGQALRPAPTNSPQNLPGSPGASPGESSRHSGM